MRRQKRLLGIGQAGSSHRKIESRWEFILFNIPENERRLLLSTMIVVEANASDSMIAPCLLLEDLSLLFPTSLPLHRLLIVHS